MNTMLRGSACPAAAAAPSVATTSRPKASQRPANTTARAQASAEERVLRSFDYNSEDGLRQKATIEHVWGVDGPPTPKEGEPWAMGWQVNERNFMVDGLRSRLVKRVASEFLGISDEEMDWRMAQLLMVVPGLESRLAVAPPKFVARLAAHTSEVAVRMLQLKQLFPEADVSIMVEKRLTLLLDDDMDEVAIAERKLRAFLPDINVDKFVEAFPLVLDYDSFEMAAQDAMRILPGTTLPELLRQNPELITSLVKGKSLIPYDQVSNPWS